jgi:hypothetical protein
MARCYAGNYPKKNGFVYFQELMKAIYLLRITRITNVDSANARKHMVWSGPRVHRGKGLLFCRVS